MNIILFSATEIIKPLSLKDERAKHILSILKKGIGDSFFAGIINAASGSAHITAIDEFFLHFSFEANGSVNAANELSLIIGFPRPIQLKRLLRSVSSLGISELHLTGTELGEKSYLKSNLALRENTEAALIDGAVQAKSTLVPILFYHNTVKECIEHFSQNPVDVRLILDIDTEAKLLSEAVAQRLFDKKKVAAAIGSERGWTANERSQFKEAQFKSCSLGERVLRTETAAVSATTLILAAMNKL